MIRQFIKKSYKITNNPRYFSNEKCGVNILDVINFKRELHCIYFWTAVNGISNVLILLFK